METLGEKPLAEWLRVVQEQVKKEPAQPRHRVFLFQLLCVLGQWNRALNQLNALAELDAATLALVHTYRAAVQCEGLRAQVFAGVRAPLLLGEPEPWMALLLEALRLFAQAHYAESTRLREEAFAQAPATPGHIEEPVTEGAFAWIADADPRLGPMLEAIIAGKYYWIPFERLRALRIEPPHDLRDLVWMPASFTWSNGGEAVGLIPTRYPGAEQADDERIVRAALTDWITVADTIQIGRGQRMLATDQGEYPLMDLRHIRFATAQADTSDLAAVHPG